MWVLFLLALMGLILSAAAHFSTYFGFDPQDSFPYVWLLHIGIFVVFVPAVAVQGTLPKDERGKLQPFAFAPKWMRRLAGAAGAYAFVNFIVFVFLMRSGSPYQENGRYLIKDHGKVRREITAQQYHQYRTYEVRGFSGHWMLFYAAAMTTLASGMAYQRAHANAGLSPQRAEQGARRRPLWAHSVFAIILQMAGFFTGPLLFIGALMLFHVRFGGFGAMLWMFTPWPGLAFARYLLRYKFPAVCPECGGRALWQSSRGANYRCADCGWTGG